MKEDKEWEEILIFKKSDIKCKKCERWMVGKKFCPCKWWIFREFKERRPRKKNV